MSIRRKRESRSRSTKEILFSMKDMLLSLVKLLVKFLQIYSAAYFEQIQR